MILKIVLHFVLLLLLLERVMCDKSRNLLLLPHSLFPLHLLSLLILFINLRHEIIISILLAHQVKLSRGDVILLVLDSSDLALLQSLFPELCQLLGYGQLLLLLVILLLHPLLHDWGWLPHLIFGFNLAGVRIHTHPHVHQLSLLLLEVPLRVLSLRQVERDFGPGRRAANVVKNFLDRVRLCAHHHGWLLATKHGAVYLLLHCLLH